MINYLIHFFKKHRLYVTGMPPVKNTVKFPKYKIIFFKTSIIR